MCRTKHGYKCPARNETSFSFGTVSMSCTRVRHEYNIMNVRATFISFLVQKSKEIFCQKDDAII